MQHRKSLRAPRSQTPPPSPLTVLATDVHLRRVMMTLHWRRIDQVRLLLNKNVQIIHNRKTQFQKVIATRELRPDSSFLFPPSHFCRKLAWNERMDDCASKVGRGPFFWMKFPPEISPSAVNLKRLFAKMKTRFSHCTKMVPAKSHKDF